MGVLVESADSAEVDGCSSGREVSLPEDPESVRRRFRGISGKEQKTRGLGTFDITEHLTH